MDAIHITTHSTCIGAGATQITLPALRHAVQITLPSARHAVDITFPSTRLTK